MTDANALEGAKMRSIEYEKDKVRAELMEHTGKLLCDVGIVAVAIFSICRRSIKTGSALARLYRLWAIS